MYLRECTTGCRIPSTLYPVVYDCENTEVSCPTEKWRAVLAVGEWRDENEQHRHRQSHKEDVGPLLSLGAMVAQRAPSTRCNELPLGSSSIANEACKQLAVEGSGGWRALFTWDATSPVTTPRERRRGNLACCSLSSLQSVHSPYQPSPISLSRQLPMYTSVLSALERGFSK